MSYNYETPDAASEAGGKHPVNILHLVMGVVFLGVVTIWGLIQQQFASTDDLRWLIPLPWVIAGATGLAVITMSSRRQVAPAQVDTTLEP